MTKSQLSAYDPRYEEDQSPLAGLVAHGENIGNIKDPKVAELVDEAEAEAEMLREAFPVLGPSIIDELLNSRYRMTTEELRRLLFSKWSQDQIRVLSERVDRKRREAFVDHVRAVSGPLDNHMMRNKPASPAENWAFYDKERMIQPEPIQKFNQRPSISARYKKYWKAGYEDEYSILDNLNLDPDGPEWMQFADDVDTIINMAQTHHTTPEIVMQVSNMAASRVLFIMQEAGVYGD